MLKPIEIRVRDFPKGDPPGPSVSSERGGSSLTPEESEEAGRPLLAARADLRAAKVLAADADHANEVIGFHAQQAVEKAIKPVLVASGVEIPYTHHHECGFERSGVDYIRLHDPVFGAKAILDSYERADAGALGRPFAPAWRAQSPYGGTPDR
jgi:hypothetical protein